MQIIAKILTIREYIYRNHFLYAKNYFVFCIL